MPAEKNNNSPGTLLSEFRRRKVVQVALAYLLLAWVIVQVADIMLPAYGAPDWALQATLTILIIGFPPAMILAWLYNLTPSGVELTTDTGWSTRLRSGWIRFTLSSVTLLLTASSVWFVWHTYLEEQRSWIQIIDQNTTPVVAVAPIQNLSGDESLEWLSDGLANLVRGRLAQSRHLVLVSSPRWQTIVRDASDPTERLSLAADADINYVVTGEILSAPGGLILTTRITDSRSGADLAFEAGEKLTAEGVLGAVYRIAIMAKQALKVPHEEQVDSFAADFAVSNVAAYHAYISGLQFFLNFDYEQAEQSMQAALELAPDFHIARYRMAMIYWVTSERDLAAEMMQAIPEDAQLSSRERAYVDAANAFIRDNDAATAIERYKSFLETYPYEVEARQYLAEAYFHDYQDDAAIAELRILGQQEPENQFVWGSLGAYLTILGQLEDALPPLQRYLELAPNKPNAYNLMGDLYREMGDFERATGYFERALELDPAFTLSQLGLAEVRAALGDIADAKSRLQAIVANKDAEVEDRVTGAFDLSWLLRAEGRFDESSNVIIAVAADIEAEQIRESMALALQAENAMQLGDADSARDLMALSIERSMRAPTRYLFARARMEMVQDRVDDVLATIEEIRSHALPPDDPDRTEDKAALFLEGIVALDRGEPEKAVAKIRKAIATEGYRYAIYKRGLAEALHQAGDVKAAIAMAAEARHERDSGNLRLDLERERALAQQLEIRIAHQSSDTAGADKLIDEYVRRWGGAELSDFTASSADEPDVGLN